jgi:hypothetical protein
MASQGNYTIPLSVYADLKEPFDDSEKKYINTYGNNSLILIEDAGEVVREFIQKRLLKILKLLSDGKIDYEIITADYDQDKLEYTIKNIEPQESNDKNCFGLIELNLDFGESGGHFGGFIRNNNEILIFDPMSYNSSENPDGGVYYPVFKSIAERVFGGDKNIRKIVYTNNENGCFQLTGGFPGNEIQRINEYEKLFSKLPDNIFFPLADNMKEYGPDSQNHFCYAWNVYWLHSMLETKINDVSILGIYPKALAKLVETCDILPVSYIKLYILRWIEFFRKDLIKMRVCSEKGGKFKYPVGYLYNFVKENFTKTLFWAYHEILPRVGAGLILRNGNIIQVITDEMRRGNCR